jgi:isopentenyl-diphosphate delta-isomerase
MTEVVVLLDESGRATGTAPKATVHAADTPLHLAFSAYLVTPDRRLLVTRRAADKATFPGVWTNSVCGHPAPGERPADAVRRRAGTELGLAVGDVRLVLPAFRYRAEMDGVVENELCPVLVAEVDAVEPRPDPTEVMDWVWSPWREFAADVVDGRRVVSHWCRLQVGELAGLGDDPLAWEPADETLLPPAARGTA